ncbi:NAD(P)-binding protein [Lophiotrema nucula]|uniref:NAD(P)-binding protein n=1 Tax=Lophiotrema nucula TaxID=690887 RepID=A0A6A5ZN59_9PLEO|nr:NAD(P)-binding protein [Lophiotrema nucula]
MPSAWQIHGRTEYSDAKHELAALQNLRLNKDVPKPSNIPAGHVLVHIRAAALNYRDLMVIGHHKDYPGPHKLDLVPAADGAGQVEAVGEGSKWKVGERVVITSVSWEHYDYATNSGRVSPEAMEGKGAGNIDGTLTEYLVLPDTHLIPAPSHLSYPELAALPAAGATAIHALFYGPRKLKAGQTVLAQGTGGVSCFVIQIAAAVGATVIVTSSSDEKLKQARSFGATHTINYRTHPNWAAEVHKLTNGRGVDVTVDVAGAATIAQSLAATTTGGLVAIVGFLTDSMPQDLIMQILFGGYTVYGLMMYTQEMTRAMVELYAEKSLKPVVDKVFEWEDVKGAFELLASQKAVGKIVVKVGSE